MHCSHLRPADVFGVLECEPQNALRGGASDEFDTLHNAVYNDMLNTRVFSLGILTDQDGVDVIIRRFVPGNGFTGADIGEKVEGAAEGEVERDMAFADWCLRRS